MAPVRWRCEETVATAASTSVVAVSMTIRSLIPSGVLPGEDFVPRRQPVAGEVGDPLLDPPPVLR